MDGLLDAVQKNSEGMVRACLQGRCDVNCRDINQNTPVMLAARNGNALIAKILLDSGADFKAKNIHGKTILMFGVQSGVIEVIHMLYSRGVNFEVNAVDNYGCTAIMEACWAGHAEILLLLLSDGGNANSMTTNGRAPIMEASLNGHAQVVRYLLNSGVSINCCDNCARTAIMDASRNGHAQVVRMLMDSGANPSFCDYEGKSASSESLAYGHHEVTRVLNGDIRAGVPAFDSGNSTPKSANVTKSLLSTISTGSIFEKTLDKYIGLGNIAPGSLLSKATGQSGLSSRTIETPSPRAEDSHQADYARASVAKALEESRLARMEVAAQLAKAAEESHVGSAANAPTWSNASEESRRADIERSAQLAKAEKFARVSDIKITPAYPEKEAALESEELEISTSRPSALHVGADSGCTSDQTLGTALTPSIFAEYETCVNLPIQIQIEVERITLDLVTARRERRLGDVALLKDKRAALNYNPTGMTAAAMRERLGALKLQLDMRYDALAEEEDDDGCVLCHNCSEKVQNILNQNSVKSDSVKDISAHSDSLILLETIQEGRMSSEKSIVLDCLYTAAHTSEQCPGKAKLYPLSLCSRALEEYNTMAKLHKAHPNYFVRPYAFVHGSKGQIKPFRSEEVAQCSASVCVVMERGAVDLRMHLESNADLTTPERLSIVSQLLDILIAARKCNVVLNDLKPANVLVVIDGYRVRLKSIDFDSSRTEGHEMALEATAAYSSPDVARAILARARGEKQVSLLACAKNDVMALGWMAFEIANGMKSYWRTLPTPITSDTDMIMALSRLTDEEVRTHVQRTFPGGQYDSLRSWLIHALRVNPIDRASADQLLNGHSLLGMREKTIDHNGLYNQILRNQNQILEKIDELSEKLCNAFDSLSGTLDCVAANIALGSQDYRESIETLEVVLRGQMDQLTFGVDKSIDQVALQSAVASSIASLEESVRSKISASIKELTNGGDVKDSSETDRLDILITMVQELHTKSDLLADDFKTFMSISNSHSDLLAIIEMNGNCMPLTFIILPEINFHDRLDSSASRFSKIKNFAQRKTRKMASLVWARSHIHFICPVTLKQVACGKDGKGYPFNIPGELVKTILPALKWGLLFLRIALATQGLGGVVPPLDMLFGMEGDELDSMISQVLDDAGAVSPYVDKASEKFLATVKYNEKQAKDAYSHVYTCIADQEDGFASHWKPKLTGLHLVSAPPGKGRSTWVSQEGMEAFQMHGEGALKKIAI